MKDFQYPDDIYTEAEPDENTLANLGPLAPMAGIWAFDGGPHSGRHSNLRLL